MLVHSEGDDVVRGMEVPMLVEEVLHVAFGQVDSKILAFKDVVDGVGQRLAVVSIRRWRSVHRTVGKAQGERHMGDLLEHVWNCAGRCKSGGYAIARLEHNSISGMKEKCPWTK